MTQSDRYTQTAIWLHWIIAILILFLLFPGEDLIRTSPGSELSGWQPTLHASLGMLVLVFSVLRLVWRVANPPPPLPVAMPAWQIRVSHVMHWTFYALMIFMPLTGWLALSPYGAERVSPEAVTFFNLFSLYLMPDLGEWTGEAHELSGKLMQLLLVLHVLAALKHQFWDKDGMLRRMSPR
jgi:cytochrome b561